VPLDIPATSVAGQTVRYAKAAWDFDRDQAANAPISIPSQQVPAGAVILGLAWSAVTRLTMVPPQPIVLQVGPSSFLLPGNPTDDWGGMLWPVQPNPSTTAGSYPILIDFSAGSPTAGAILIYVFYV